MEEILNNFKLECQQIQSLNLYNIINYDLKQIYCRYQNILQKIRVQQIQDYRKGLIDQPLNPIKHLTQALYSYIEQQFQLIDIIEQIHQQLITPNTQFIGIIQFVYQISIHDEIWVIYQENEFIYQFKGRTKLSLFYQYFEDVLINQLSFIISQWNTLQNYGELYKNLQKFCDYTCPQSWERVCRNVNILLIENQKEYWIQIINQARSLLDLKQLSDLFDYLSDDNNDYHLLLSIAYQEQITYNFKKQLSILPSLKEQDIEFLIIIEDLYQSFNKFNSTLAQHQFYETVLNQTISIILQDYFHFIIILLDKALIQLNKPFFTRIIKFVAFLQDDSLFIQYLLKSYQQRLLNSLQPQLSDLDQLLLKTLKKGNQNLTQLENLFQEVIQSKQYNYSQNNISAHYLVISLHNWDLNISLINDHSYQLQPLEHQQYFENQLLTQHKLNYQNRVVDIIHPMTKVEILFTPSSNLERYNIQLYIQQYQILMKFQKCDKIQQYLLLISLSKFQGLEQDLQKLVQRQFLLIEDEEVVFNTKFQSDKKSINYQYLDFILFQKRFVTLVKQREDQDNYQYKLSALIVKMLKQAKTVTYADLYQFILSQKGSNNLVAEQGQIKRVLENLIEQQYIKRSEDQTNSFEYNP